MSTAVKLQRNAKGERPYFFADPNVDKVVAMLMGLAGEVAVMRDRLDTLERLLERTGALQRADIEQYRPDARVTAERAAWREAFLAEVLRIVEIEVEALAAGDEAPYASAIALVEDGASSRRAAPTKTARQASPNGKAKTKPAAATARPTRSGSATGVARKPAVKASPAKGTAKAAASKTRGRR